MSLFRAGHPSVRGQKGSHSKICHIYLKIVKFNTVIPNLKKIQEIYKLHDTPLYSKEISNFCHVKKYRYRLTSYIIPNYSHFFESLKLTLINRVAILMMTVKLTTLGLLK